MHTQRTVGRVLSCLAVLFLLFDSVGKLLLIQPVIDGTRQLGYPPDLVFGLGLLLLFCTVLYLIPRTSALGALLLLFCTVLYLIPRTSALGALLLTGYLGGAVATHVRVGSPLFTHVLFPTYVAAFIWSGLVLRHPALRVILPVGRTA